MNSAKTVVILTPGFARDEQDSTCLPFLQEYVLTLKKNSSYSCKIVALQYPFDRKITIGRTFLYIPCEGKKLEIFFPFVHLAQSMGAAFQASSCQ